MEIENELHDKSRTRRHDHRRRKNACGPPCNVILREVDGGVEISAIDPAASMQAIDNPDLTRVAGQVRDMLADVVKHT